MVRQIRHAHLATLPLLAAGLLLVAASMAAQESQQQEDVHATTEEIERCAGAYVEVIEIQERFGERLQQAEDAEEAQQLQQQANSEMEQIIEDHGLTVPDYNRVIQAVSADEEYREIFVAKLQEIQEGDEDGS